LQVAEFATQVYTCTVTILTGISIYLYS